MAGAVNIESKQNVILPLRQDLHLNKGIIAENGSPTWTIFDHSNGLFYKIGVIEFELLSRWHYLDKDKILQSCYKETNLFPTTDDFDQLVEFLKEKNLFIPEINESDNLYQKSLSTKENLFNKIIKNYLFFRIPFAHPNSILGSLEGIANLVYTKTFFQLIFSLVIFNIILFFQNMDVVLSSSQNPLSSINYGYVALALIFSKFFHEFGHILSCVKHKVKVPSIGVAFLVMFPMLYVDSSESWKINDNKKRLLVSSAGISFEVILALICFPLYLWVDDESLKKVLLYISITSLSISLFLNASPFMRFDGYFILQDILKEENLHDKSFAAFKNKIRKFLFGLNFGENHPKENFYALFGFLTGLYRLILYFGIAIAVYHMFIKVVGIILFIIELYYFILMPIFKELKYYQKIYPMLEKQNKRKLFIKVGAISSIILLFQFSASINTIGYISPKEYRELYAPFAGQIKFKKENETVSKNETLFSLENFELSIKKESLANNMKYAQDYYNKISVSEKELNNLNIAKNKINLSKSRSDLNEGQLNKLEIKADFDGILSDTSDDIKINSFVSKGEFLGVYYNKNDWIIRAYVNEEQLSKVNVGNSVNFYSTSMMDKIVGKVHYIHKTPILYLPNMLLIDENNADFAIEDIKSDKRIKNGVKSKKPLYQIDIMVPEQVDFNQVKKGNIVIKTGLFYNLDTHIKSLFNILLKEFNLF